MIINLQKSISMIFGYFTLTTCSMIVKSHVDKIQVYLKAFLNSIESPDTKRWKAVQTILSICPRQRRIRNKETLKHSASLKYSCNIHNSGLCRRHDAAFSSSFFSSKSLLHTCSSFPKLLWHARESSRQRISSTLICFRTFRTPPNYKWFDEL